MNKAFMKLAIALELLKISIRTELLKMLGVDVLIERAFKEGYSMALEDDFGRLQRELLQPIKTEGQLRVLVLHSRCWRSVDEAWVNSDAQEMFE